MPAPHVGRFRIGVFEELIIILEIQLAGGRAQGLKAFAIGEIEAERLFVEEALVTGLIFLLDRLQEAISQFMQALVEIDVLLTVLHLLLDEDVEFLDQPRFRRVDQRFRSEEHTSELQSLMRISYADFCLKKTK